MTIKSSGNPGIKRIAACLCLVIITAVQFIPTLSYAQESAKTVRVGWYESPYNMTDKFGRRSGYAYEFQKKIAAYADWKYEYVVDSWPNLLQMLIDGKIDLMSDISYTEERAGLMLFPSHPMGSEEYYVFVAPGNVEYASASILWFNGKKIGVNSGSIQEGFFYDWQKAHGIDAEVIPLTCTEDESFQMMNSGELDAFITIDAYGGSAQGVPIVKIGSSESFFAVNKDRRDLLEDLDAAFVMLYDENRFYSQQLFDKYIGTSGANLFLNTDEKKWLSEHGSIRVGYQDDCLSFCAKDKKTGELTGALKDYLYHASDCLENSHIDFEPIAFPSSFAAIEALKKGEVDCIFPSNLSTSDGEMQGLVLTPPIMRTEVYAVIKKSDKNTFAKKEQITTAIERGDLNYTSVIFDNFPDWQVSSYADIRSCLYAVSKGNADCFLISNYQYNNLVNLCERYNLVTFATGKEVEYCIAVKNGNKELYSILSRITGIVNNTSINASLSYYSTEESKKSLVGFVKDHPIPFFAGLFFLFALIVVIIEQHRIIRAEKEVEKSHSQVDALNKRVFIDALTSVNNKGAFNNSIIRLQDQLDSGAQPEFAIAVFDCDDLKMINDRYGHDKGDIYLQTAAQQLLRTFESGSVFRIGGDEFAVILEGDSYKNRYPLITAFEKSSKELCASTANEWERVSMAAGLAEYESMTDSSVNDVIHHADKRMYENKFERKKAKA